MIPEKYDVKVKEGMRMKATVRDIAKRAGVSTASVSLVLNKKPSRITEETKQRILDAANELGYQVREKKIRLDGERLIGVIRPKYNEFIDSCMEGIRKYALIHGSRVLICDVDDSTEQAMDYLEILVKAGAEGIIMIPPLDMNEENNNTKLGEALRNIGIPYILLDQAIDRVFCDFITADNKAGGYMATEYLIHKGHENIGIIAGKQEVYTTRKRVEGYKEALAYYNRSIHEENIFYGNYGVASGYKATEYFYYRGIHALFACNDKMALGVYQFAKEKGLFIGEDLSLVAFNELETAEFLAPALTTINQSGELMGKKACEVILKRMAGVEQEAVSTIYFTPQLVERESVKNMSGIS